MDKYAYYASQAVYGSGVHHDYLTNDGYVVDNELSFDGIRTYVKDGRALVSYKGTNPLDFSDLDADLNIAFGTQRSNSQFRNASIVAKKAKEKYGNVVTTGHSLGGTKAIESANAIGGKAIVFNPGTGLFKLDTGDHRVYVKRQDPISVRVKGSNIDWSDGGHTLSGYEDRFNPRVQRGSGVRAGRRVRKKGGWRIY